MKKVLVIGGGPAGMMAATTAALNGARVTLLEKKQKVGRKLAITGKGRCNITSSVDRQDLIAGFPGHGRFLYSAFNEFSNYDLIDFLKNLGLKTKVERGNRVFPQSDKAIDVVNTLYKNMLNLGVQVMTGSVVTGLIIKDAKVSGVKINNQVYSADAVIVATGGVSYPATGSTGDGYDWAIKAGHKIIEPRPGLVPLLVKEEWVKELQGLGLKNVKATSFIPKGKKINEEFGELLFTHFGLSGPIILTMSRDIAEYLYKKGGEITMKIDLKPALDEEKLDARLQRDLAKFSRRQFHNSLEDLLPRKLIPVIVDLSGINPTKECNQLSRAERKDLVYLLKNLTLKAIGTRPIEEAIVTAGGVDVNQINPKTMQSKLVQNLYFAGEILDIDGYTGGFNLQASFSTGYVAGKYAAKTV